VGLAIYVSTRASSQVKRTRGRGGQRLLPGEYTSEGVRVGNLAVKKREGSREKKTSSLNGLPLLRGGRRGMSAPLESRSERVGVRGGGKDC